MADILIFNPLNRIIWSFTIILLFLCGISYYYRGKKSKTPNDKYLLYGFSALLIGIATHRLSFFISDFYAVGYYIGNEFYGYYNISDPIYSNLVSAGYLAFFISMTISIVMFESVLKESKYFFSFLSFIALMTFIYIPISWKVALRYFLIVINGLLLLAILLRLLNISNKKSQLIARFMSTSLMLYVIGSFTDSGQVKQLELGYQTLPTVFFISSALVGLTPMIINLDLRKVKKSLLLNLIFLFATIGISLIYLLGITLTSELLIIVFLCYTIGLFILILYFYRISSGSQ
jgi:hypothetical protein